jgi:hypothetical protein
VIALAAGITWVVVRVFPATTSNKTGPSN